MFHVKRHRQVLVNSKNVTVVNSFLISVTYPTSLSKDPTRVGDCENSGKTNKDRFLITVKIKIAVDLLYVLYVNES